MIDNPFEVLLTMLLELQQGLPFPEPSLRFGVVKLLKVVSKDSLTLLDQTSSQLSVKLLMVWVLFDRTP